jgi:hypothetical protein
VNSYDACLERTGINEWTASVNATFSDPDKAVCGSCLNLSPPCVNKEGFEDMLCYMDPCVAVK